jgi:hypothetical protein
MRVPECRWRFSCNSATAFRAGGHGLWTPEMYMEARHMKDLKTGG